MWNVNSTNDTITCNANIELKFLGMQQHVCPSIKDGSKVGCRSASSWTVLCSFVNDAPAVLEEYYKETVISFGVHNSSRKCHSQLEDKKNDETQDGRKVDSCTCRLNTRQ